VFGGERRGFEEFVDSYAVELWECTYVQVEKEGDQREKKEDAISPLIFPSYFKYL
jgi:hypothetical protein